MALPGMTRHAPTLDVADVQGLVVRGYGRLPHAAFLACRIRDAQGARAVLRDLIGEVGSGVGHDADTALQVAFTASGLVALGLRDDVIERGFAAPFVEGMTTEHRQRLLGDVGAADPRHWAWGGPDTPPVHVLLLVYAVSAGLLDERRGALLAAAGGALELVADLPTDELGDREAFGFADGLTQPRLAGLPGARDGRTLPTGEFVLGYPNAYGQLGPRPLLDPTSDPQRILPRDPGGSGKADMGCNGSYLVLRQLRQDVETFTGFLRERTRRADGAEDEQAQERLAAKMVGRWRSGAPLVLAPDRDAPETAYLDFGYHAEDPHGLACPLGAHIRRANPRDALPPQPGSERSLQLTDHHRLLRRARNYTQNGERGLHFLCLVGDLSRQYEFVQHSWINDPVFDGLHDDADPLVAPRGPRGGTFVEQVLPVRRRHRDLPEFVRVRGGAYFFLPGLSALRYLTQILQDEESS